MVIFETSVVVPAPLGTICIKTNHHDASLETTAGSDANGFRGTVRLQLVAPKSERGQMLIDKSF